MSFYKIYAGLKSLDGAVYRETVDFNDKDQAFLYSYGLACLDFEEHFEDLCCLTDFYQIALHELRLDQSSENLEESEEEIEESISEQINEIRDDELVYYVEEI